MRNQGKAYIALVFICIVWGTTYLAIRVGVAHYPAFLFAGVRQFIAGIVLAFAALLINKNKDLSRHNILRQMLVGFLMLSIGNGCVTYGEKYVSSGVAALICSMMPLFSVIISLISSNKERFNSFIIAGLVLGFFGVALIFRNNITELGNKAYIGGISCVFLASFSWAVGSAISKKHKSPVNPVFNSALQLFFGGVFMLIASPVLDGAYTFTVWQPQALLSLLYLITFGSVLAYAAYMYAFSALPVGIATIYAYINPLVAVILGYLILSEPLTIYTAFSFIAILAGVYLVNKGYKKQHIESKTKNVQDTLVTVVPVES
jgi:drug/metabolite transporter (DMT)-like permease